MSDDELRKGILELARILDKGIAMEHGAHIYYSMAAQRSPTVEGKKMFQWLADFELNHEDKLRRKKQELLEHPEMKGVSHPPLDKEYTLSEGGESIDLPPEPSETDILRLAIMNEKIAYAFYQRKLTHAADDSLRTMFETFAREEEKHIKILSELRQRLMIDGLWGDVDAFEDDLKHD